MGSRQPAGRAMSVPSLPKQLLRDLRRNPKKAGLLALLAGVALWFWAPLVVSWFKSGDANPSDVEQASAAVVGPATAIPNEGPAATTRVTETASQTWQQLVRWM